VADWRNRIIETRTVSAAELQAHPSNWRQHPASQSTALRGLLAQVGIVAPLIAYDSEQYGGLVLLDGHLRQETGGEWPCVVLDVSDAEADIILAAFDPLTGLAEMDAEALAQLLGRVEMLDMDDGLTGLLDELGFEAESLAQTELDEAPEASDRKLGDKRKQIKPVLYADEIADFERALRSTGRVNRGAALLEVCRYYLENHEEGQLDDQVQNLLAAKSAPGD
jgi:hypothetical protein